MTAALHPRPTLRPLPGARRAPAHLTLAPPSPRSRPVPAEVLRRRRAAAALIALVAVAALAVGAVLAVGWLGASATSSPAPAGDVGTTVVARPGDTYLSLAREVHDGGDLRSTVDALLAANGGRELRPGDRLVLAG
jgi:hypothetical protein